jgi:hypothetical protein
MLWCGAGARVATDKPPLPERMAPAVAAARSRVSRRRTINPGVAVDGRDGVVTLGPPHADLASWQVQIVDAFGTNSFSTAMAFLQELAALTRKEWNENSQSLEPSERDLNAALNIVVGARPSNELEAAFAAQMVAVHWMQMRVSALALEQDCWNPETVGQAAKLARTFALQIETFAKLKGKSRRQHITVRTSRHSHQHIHVSRPEGGQKTSGQPHVSIPVLGPSESNDEG